MSASGTDTHKLDKNEARTRIEHEDNLVNHRVSWLIGSQSFLLTAFVLLRNSPTYYSDASVVSLTYLERTSSLVYFLCLIGILISACSFVGVVAAFSAINVWKSYAPKESAPILVSKAFTARLGGLVAILPGPVIGTIWGLLLISEWPAIGKHLTLSSLLWPLGVAFAVFALWVIDFSKVLHASIPSDS